MRRTISILIIVIAVALVVVPLALGASSWNGAMLYTLKAW
jgi:hypothetical protein